MNIKNNEAQMTLIALGIVLLALYLSAMVILVQYKKDTSIANFTWGGGVMLVTLFTFVTCSLLLPRQWLITGMMVAWALRLICHVYKRYTGKDPRFSSWHWQGFKALVINIIWVFGQTIMIAIMGYPATLINMSVTPGLTVLDCCGLLVWLTGFVCEAISDHQLFMFMSNPTNKGRVMRYGLWRYSRHPNYFGEVIMWWGVYLIALSVPYGWTAVIAPATITFLLLFVTGIPWIEKAMANNPEYQEYKRKTSVFIPWFVKE